MAAPANDSLLRRTIKVVAVNAAMFLALMVVVELVFGNWVRPFGLRDLKRFSIPTGVSYTFDASSLYPVEGSQPITYSRDQWGLRGSARSLADYDVVTVGGSTTDQRYLDDTKTWQAVIQRELRSKGWEAATVANAGVDGQSTIGHVFDFRFWFPLLEGLRPRWVLFYVGINDVLKGDDRDAYDRAIDATAWRNKSVLFQIYKIVQGNVRARQVGVAHGRHRPAEVDFTSTGLLNDDDRRTLSAAVTSGFLERVDTLRDATLAWGARPVFVTQTAYGWNADQLPPRGMKGEVRSHGRTLNYADVAAIHQQLNRALVAHCAARQLACFDLASDLALQADDYYDPLHNTPAGAEKIGRYLAGRLWDESGRGGGRD